MSASKLLKLYKKIALTLSLCMLLVWTLLGTGASLAWFVDTSEEVTNIFHVAEFDLEVSQRMSDGSWQSIDSRSDIFGQNAVYEPGYVQVVYLRIENNGTRAFDFQASVRVTGYSIATNYFGDPFSLHEHLKYGVVYADTVEAMEDAVRTRELAKAVATEDLGDFTSDVMPLEAGRYTYMALIVRMPEEVGNEANYRGDVIPTVELGIIVNATQQHN